MLDAHGLAPMASYQLESRRIGASAPPSLRERLLPLYQGTVNDNVFKLMTLKAALRGVDVPVVLLDGAGYVDWLYPHLAFRPVGDLRLAVRGADGQRFAEAVKEAGFAPVGTGEGGHTACFGDGRIELHLQEGLVEGQLDDRGLFDRREPLPAVGPTASRPSAEDALLVAVDALARNGLFGPLLLYVDVRELLAQPALADRGTVSAVLERAEAARLSRALYGACRLVATFYPEATERAAALTPELGRVERTAVDALVERARDPARLRQPRGAEAAARTVVAP